jgi:FkbM family methyltransferase
MWIFCCGAVRSGSTLQYNIVSELVEHAGAGKRIEFVPPGEFSNIREKYKDYSGYKVFKSHLLTEEIELEFNNRNAKGIYSYRDLRDVVISLAKKNNKDYDSYIFDEQYLKSNINNAINWERVTPIYRSKYETFAFDLETEIYRISRFLELDVPKETIKDIASKLSIEKQKKIINDTVDFKELGGNKFNSKTLLHHNHINSGEKEQWRKQLTKKHIRRIEETGKDWLVNNGYPLKTKSFYKTVNLYSYSQHGEDEFIWKYFNKKRNGLIVEIGAFDGIHLSNSYALNKIGWKSITVEPNPDFFYLLAFNRPNAINYNFAAVAKEETKTVDFNKEEIGLLSGILMDHDDVIKRYCRRGLDFHSSQITVEARTLNSILKENTITTEEIDCITIDVEGTEIDVLGGFDISYYKPKMIIAEANNSDSEISLFKFLGEKRYKKIHQFGPNIVFVPQGSKSFEKYYFEGIQMPQIHPLGKKYTIQANIEKNKPKPSFYLRLLSKFKRLL